MIDDVFTDSNNVVTVLDACSNGALKIVAANGQANFGTTVNNGVITVGTKADLSGNWNALTNSATGPVSGITRDATMIVYPQVTNFEGGKQAKCKQELCF